MSSPHVWCTSHLQLFHGVTPTCLQEGQQVLPGALPRCHPAQQCTAVHPGNGTCGRSEERDTCC